MRYSKFFGRTSKTVSADADSTNAKLLTQGGFVVKQMAGVYNFLPLGLRVLTKIQNIIRAELDMLGAQEILMPALTQEENYETTSRQTMDVLFHLEGSGGSKLVLNPTHEEIVTPLVQKFVFSYKDLPLAVYQIQNKFRNEPRAKSGILRGREFNMKDLYSFHASEEGLDEYYEKIKEVYFNIYRNIGLKEVVLTYASGGAFTRYSHEFQVPCEVGEDTIYICQNCHQAINKEIINDIESVEGAPSCPHCMGVDLLEHRAIEVGNIFKLRSRFSDAFKFMYKDKNGKEQHIEMGCYGIGPSRIMGTLVEVSHDEKGIIWPESVAPYKVHLIVLGKETETYDQATSLYQQFLNQNIEVLYDDREEVTAGEKFADADLIGIPYRVVVSKKTLQSDSVELKHRNKKNVELVSFSKIISQFN